MAFEVVKKNLEDRGFAVTVCETAADAAEYLNKAIDDKTVGIGGSLTIKELDIHNKLVLHNEVYWHWLGGNTDRELAADADVYLTSANGLAETGEIINIDGIGNRVASTLYGHEKVYFVIGRNKLAPTYEEALWRARNIAAPKNAKKLGKKTPCAINGDRCYDCKSPDRICRGLVVHWTAMMGMEMEVVLVDEDLGF
jgi:L-lactate utilization protein LutB